MNEKVCKACHLLHDEFDLEMDDKNCKRCNYPFAMDAPAQDNVNHPAHYTSGKVECIDAIEAALTPEEFRGYCKGNAMKYIWRERMKGGEESLAKACWYLDRILK